MQPDVERFARHATPFARPMLWHVFKLGRAGGAQNEKLAAHEIKCFLGIVEK
ncbi:hypothetical protein [Rheinheimera tilapiae]|uniref:Uncharacterized protein n=1 Tax=Rheinheimera tilapiae TaxID=875043 RepID=A0ABV6BE72_9GAMM